MKEFKQAFSGIALALLSVIFLMGSMTLAFSEGQPVAAMRVTAANTAGPQFILTLGQPTLTPLASQIIHPKITAPLMPTACPQPNNWAVITIQPGDDLPGLAASYQTTVDALKQANCLLIDTLVVGATIYVPGIHPTEPIAGCHPYDGWVYYMVQVGDTLYQISLNFNTSVAELRFANCLASDLIQAGQQLYVPNRPPQRTPIPAIPTITPLPTLTPLPPTATETPPPSATMTDTPIPTTEPAPPTETQTPTPSETPTLPPSPTSTPTPEPSATPTLPPSDTPAPPSETATTAAPTP
jgi:LysM repeat protein